MWSARCLKPMAPDSGGAFQIQVGPPTRKKLGCLPAAVMETAIDGAASIRTVDNGAMIDQQFHQRQLVGLDDAPQVSRR